MKALQLFILLVLILSGYVQAIVNGKTATETEWRSVVLLEFVDPDNGQPSSCTGVIISASYVITSASCVLHEETGKHVSSVKVCIGQKRPFKRNNEGCQKTDQIYSHHGYVNDSLISTANNLAYIKLKEPLNLNHLNIKPATLITPAEFSKLVMESGFPKITWVGFDAKSIQKPMLGKKQQGTVENAEYDYQSRSLRVTSSNIRPGNHYEGMASFVKSKRGDWRLLGIVSESSPDNLVTYYPEINPCDEDPILVRYPEPLIQVSTLITIYPVAACGMTDFFPATGFDELSCELLLSNKLDWSNAIENNNPIAMRQHALSLYQNNQSMDDAGEIYKLLYIAYQAGDHTAGLKLAEFLLEGRLFSKDTDTARQLITELIELDVPSANLLLAKLMLFPDDNETIEPSLIERDKSILSLLEKAAISGLVEAQYLSGRLYQLGIGTNENHKIAHKWYAQAAMQGHADGQFQLGMQWQDGRGVRPYLEVADFWIHKAAAQGHIEAQNRLGLLKPVANQ